MTRNDDDAIDELAQALSDAADGRAALEQLRALGVAWSNRPELQRDWQAIHVIGDSLRSADLAHHAQDRETLLAGLRTRLANEPSPARTPRWFDWTKPMAVAAGFIGFAVLLLPSLHGAREAEALAYQQPAQQLPMTTGSTLVGGAPSFAQSVLAAPPVASPVLLREAAQETGAAPLEIAVPASAAAVTSALPRR